jgi:hypothetical protein
MGQRATYLVPVLLGAAGGGGTRPSLGDAGRIGRRPSQAASGAVPGGGTIAVDFGDAGWMQSPRLADCFAGAGALPSLK